MQYLDDIKYYFCYRKIAILIIKIMYLYGVYTRTSMHVQISFNILF